MTWASDLFFGGMKSETAIKSLLSTEPLAKLLQETINFDHLQANLEQGIFGAVEVTCTDYGTSNGTSFVQNNETGPLWRRVRRHGVGTKLSLDHLLASSAIPIFFPPRQIGSAYFGDGCLRNSAPLSPAIHLGADRILVISTQHRHDSWENIVDNHLARPSVARILGVMMSAVLLDAVSLDIERVDRINHTVSLIPEHLRHQTNLREISALALRPSQDIGKCAKDYIDTLPRSIRYLMEGLGSKEEASELLSYLIFEPDYCKFLVEMGHHDATSQKDEIISFMTSNSS